MTDRLMPSDAIRPVMTAAEDIAKAAGDCVSNFIYLQDSHGSRPIHLLDFDVIRGVLPEDRVDRTPPSSLSRMSSPPRASRRLEILLGPDLISHHLTSLSRTGKYTIPSGCATELFEWKKKTHGALSLKSEAVLRRLSEIPQSENPAAELMRAGGDGTVISTLHDEMRDIVRMSDSLKLIERVSRDAEPISELLKQTRMPGDRLVELTHSTSEVYTKARNVLNDVRDETVNNERDALNVLELALLMSESPRGRGFLPVLISGTRVVEALPGLKNLVFPRHRRDLQEIAFVQNLMFLIVVTALLDFSEDAYKSAIRVGGKLQNEANRLEAACFEALYARTNDPDAFDSKHEEAENELRKFQVEWLSVFMPTTIATQSDQVSYINEVLRREVEILQGLGPNEGKRYDYRSVVDFLRRLRDEGDSLIKPGVLLPINLDLLTVEQMMQISAVRNQGQPLYGAAPGSAIGTMTNGNDQFDVRYLVHSRTHPDLGAILALDVFRGVNTPSGQRLVLLWPHDCDVIVMWEQGVRLLQDCLRIEEGGGDQLLEFVLHYAEAPSLQGSYMETFTREGNRIRGSTALRDVTPVQLFVQRHQPAYVELVAGHFGFLAHVTPVQTELRAGLALEPGAFRPRIRSFIAASLRQTSSFPSGEAQYEAILEQLDRKLRLSRAGPRS